MSARFTKAAETMTSRERVTRTFHFEKTDRVAIDYSANITVHGRLATALGLAANDYEGVYQALGVDYRGYNPPYVGGQLFPASEKEGVSTNSMYGYRTRWIENQAGGYNDYCDFPLKDAPDDVIAEFPLPSPDDFDYSTITPFLEKHRDKAVYVGGPGTGDVINQTSMMMGMEQTLINLQLRHEATLEYVRRRTELNLGRLERMLERANGNITFMFLGEDLGTQLGPMISMDLYKQVIRPMHAKYTALAKQYNLPVMMHSCGSSSWAYEGMIEIGVNAIDTVQPEAANMSPQYLKDRFHGRLSFHGAISTAGPLAYGTPSDVTRVVRETIAILNEGGGYHLAPTHLIQDNTPVENILAMYQEAHSFK